MAINSHIFFDEDYFFGDEITQNALFEEDNMDFWQGTSIDQTHLISFGQSEWYLNNCVGIREHTVEVIWNTFNSKILVRKSEQLRYVQCVNSNVYDIEHWLFDQVFDYNAIFDRCLVDWTDDTFEDWNDMTKYVSNKFSNSIEIYIRTIYEDIDMDELGFYHFYVY
eukprot:87846_1